MTAQALPKTLKSAAEFHDFGCKQWEKKDFASAFAGFQKAYEMEPESPGVMVSYSLCLMQQEKFAEAEQLLRKAIKLKPDLADAYDKLSHALFKQDKLAEAIENIKVAVQLKPNHFSYVNKLGALLTSTAETTEALFWLEKAVKLNPNHVSSRINYGSILSRQGFHKEAIEQFYKAIEIQPDYESAYYNILAEMEQNHKLEEMHALIKKAEKNIPNTTTLAIIKARLAKREKKYDDAIKFMEPVTNKKDDTLHPDLMFELGTTYDRVGRYDDAYDAFCEANTTRLTQREAKKYSFDHFPDLVSTLSEPFTPEWVAEWSETYPSDTYKTPNFIIGFPRSGTTLTGQILDSHPKLFVAEEIEALERARIYLAATHPNTYPGCFKTLGLGDIEKMRAIFYANHRNNAIWEENKTLIDKHPLNMARMGTAYRIFPDAKYIFVARHPCDCILSSFMQNFGMNDAMVQMTSLERAINFYMLCMDIWKRYQKAMPDLNVHTIHYEDLIEDFNSEVSNMLSFLDLEWDDAVLSYNKNAAAKPRTNTPSYSQIIEPIYKRAANRWRNYEKHFEPYMDRLKPYIEELGYEA